MFSGSASESGCMYCLISPDITLGSQSDYFQLCWLVLWILDDTSGDYHARRWEDQKVDAFIKKLVENGEYHAGLLETSTLVVDTQSLASVLQEQSSGDTQ